MHDLALRDINPVIVLIGIIGIVSFAWIASEADQAWKVSKAQHTLKAYQPFIKA